tara:strand:- start:490 stop:1620 length:1131 start_codon:yes stop_codon:yes gene_type:complete
MALSIGGIVGTLAGGMLSSNAAGKASDAQSASDAARLAEEKRVREQLRVDTGMERTIADQAFSDYESGLITLAEAQQRSANSVGNVQTGIAQSQLADTAKMTNMANFQPYSIKTATGGTFFDKNTGTAGFNLSPEMKAYQDSLYGTAQTAAGGLTATPEAAAQAYMTQQQGLLQPQREADDIALRNQQLSQGRIGMGISSEAAGAGAGGMVNQQQFQRDRARAQADAQIAAEATQAGQLQQANQLKYTQGLFNAGQAPETYGMEQLNRGFDMGSLQAQIGARQAGIYGNSMNNVYNNLGGAANTYAQGALRVPQAMLTGAQGQFERQQTGLTGLQGNELQYKTMTTPEARVPGSAYLGAAVGNRVLDQGLNSLYRD